MSDWRHIAIVLAAGKGKRMETQRAKQYLLLKERPILYYSLKAFQDSFIDDIILVTGGEDLDYCRAEIVEKYGFFKVRAIVPGGKERYHSVYAGLEAVRSLKNAGKAAVYIHDGARPFLAQEILHHLKESVERYGSAVAAVPAKDTIKIVDGDGFVTSTPDRTKTWQVQTPQCFDFDWIYPAYKHLIADEEKLKIKGVHITDDAMAAELYSERRVHLVEADYRNIKITTPEDLLVAERFLNE